MTTVSVQCKFPDCKKELEVSENMKYCPYCATSFELYGFKLKGLIDAADRRFERLNYRQWANLIAFSISWILFGAVSIWFMVIYDSVSNGNFFVLLLVGLLCCSAFIILFDKFYTKKKAISKFPDIPDSNPAS